MYMLKAHCLDCNRILPRRSAKKGYTICRHCTHNRNKPNPLYCMDCGNELKKRAIVAGGKRCRPCSNKNRVTDPNYKENHKRAMELLAKDPKWLEKRLATLSRLRKNPEWQANTREALLRLHNDPAWKENQRLVMDRVRKDLSYKENQLNGFKKWLKSKKPRTSIEKKVFSVLNEIGVKFSEQKFIKRYAYDFYLPNQKILIETDGCFWHGCSICGFKKSDTNNDDIKTQLASEFGFSLLRLPEHSINADPEYAKTKILNLLCNP